jgi:hypothetical protein
MAILAGDNCYTGLAKQIPMDIDRFDRVVKMMSYQLAKRIISAHSRNPIDMMLHD